MYCVVVRVVASILVRMAEPDRSMGISQPHEVGRKFCVVAFDEMFVIFRSLKTYHE
jgi:hypothetical protein